MLYQLSYASPYPPMEAPSGHPEDRADTLPLRAYHGTEIKVSTPCRGSKPTPALPFAPPTATICLDILPQPAGIC